MTNDDPETFMFIPMAISLAFGVLFATAITLFLVPSLYLMLRGLPVSRGAPLRRIKARHHTT